MSLRRSQSGNNVDSELLHFLTEISYEEHEAYFPSDQESYLGHSYFRPSSLEEVQECWKGTIRLIREGRAPREIGLYLHWPFCPSRCLFCFCYMGVPDSTGILRRHAQSLRAELTAFAEVFRGVPFTSFYFGGGTPTFMPDAELESILNLVRRDFPMDPAADICMEVSPVTVTDNKMDILRAHGINHITLGVQTLDPVVLRGLDRRGQTPEVVRRAHRLVSQGGRTLVSIDLMLGLQGQTEDSFLRDFHWALGVRPYDIRVYVFDPRSYTAFARYSKVSPPRASDVHSLTVRLDAEAAKGGYELPCIDVRDPNSMCATRQTWMARKCGGSVLGVGSGAISHAYGTAWYEHPPQRIEAGLKSSMPPFRLLESGIDEEMRGMLIRNLTTQGVVWSSAFQAQFGIKPMEMDFICKTVHKLRMLGQATVVGDDIFFRNTDRLPRIVFSKTFYSSRLRRLLMRRRGRQFQSFIKAYPNMMDSPRLQRKEVANLLRMYHDPMQPHPVRPAAPLTRS